MRKMTRDEVKGQKLLGAWKDTYTEKEVKEIREYKKYQEEEHIETVILWSEIKEIMFQALLKKFPEIKSEGESQVGFQYKGKMYHFLLSRPC